MRGGVLRVFPGLLVGLLSSSLLRAWTSGGSFARRRKGQPLVRIERGVEVSCAARLAFLCSWLKRNGAGGGLVITSGV